MFINVPSINASKSFLFSFSLFSFFNNIREICLSFCRILTNYDIIKLNYHIFEFIIHFIKDYTYSLMKAF